MTTTIPTTLTISPISNDDVLRLGRLMGEALQGMVELMRKALRRLADWFENLSPSVLAVLQGYIANNSASNFDGIELEVPEFYNDKSRKRAYRREREHVYTRRIYKRKLAEWCGGRPDSGFYFDGEYYDHSLETYRGVAYRIARQQRHNRCGCSCWQCDKHKNRDKPRVHLRNALRDKEAQQELNESYG